MLKTKFIKKTIISLLTISLIYANANLAVLGFVTYAIDNTNAEITDVNDETNPNEKILKIEISDFSKNNMQEQETEYQEKLILNLEQDNEIKRVKILDEYTKINLETIEENTSGDSETEDMEEEQNINIFYKTTKINKEELLNKIGTNGVLEIKYKELEIEDETNEEEDIIVLPEIETEEKAGVVNAENGSIIITSETKVDEEGNITIVYPENTISLEMTVETEAQKIENLEILNSRTIEKILEVDKINELETVKQVTVQNIVEVIEETVKTPIEYTKTFTELGIDKSQISSIVENKLNLTITMHTENIKYDLNRNPYFVIELPNIVDKISIENVVILNNPCFTITSIEQTTLENGNKAIIIKLEGEQTEYTESTEENVQMVLEVAIKAKDLIPSIDSFINLYYQNENVKTYDGKTVQENGFNSVPIKFVANKEVIVQTQAMIGEEVISSPRDNYKSINIEPNTYQNVGIFGMAINNTGEKINQLKILGKATNVGEISGIETVYYSQNENATIDLNDIENGWSTEYIPNAKRYLIIVENFEQAQAINFGYYMNLPANIETDIDHEVMFEVYDDSNQIINTSKISIYQEAQQFDTYSDEKIKADISFGDITELEIGEMLGTKISITNISEQEVKNVGLYLELPDNLEYAYTNVNSNNTLNLIIGNKISINNINLEAGGTSVIEIYAQAKNYTEASEKITANVTYEGKQIEIFDKIKLASPAKIETSITSNKVGKVLYDNEDIEYTVTLKNSGQSVANIDFTVPQLENIYIQKIETINKTTEERKSIASGDLTNGIAFTISPNNEIEVKINCIVLPQEETETIVMYASITGDTINSVKTDEIYNKINKKNDVKTDNKNEDVNDNSIFGVAWVDKNENGKQDANEIPLKGVQAVLINTQNLKEIDKQITNNKGEYNFEDVEEGRYIVEFRYNTQTLGVTKYKNEVDSENLDSDIINVTQNNETTAKTEVMTVTDGETINANAGFVINKKFDMKIDKTINNISVTNEEGTNSYNFDGTNMAKIEIDGKYLKGSMILIEYEVAITNIGEVEGYAKLISDKIPEGTKFNSELNKDWYQANDGNLYSSSLANKKLLPGETATIKLVLTKEMTDDKVVSPVNIANIQETYNEYFIQDKDPSNDTSDATVIISIRTGDTQTYIWLIIVVILIISVGTFGLIKITNKK